MICILIRIALKRKKSYNMARSLQKRFATQTIF